MLAAAVLATTPGNHANAFNTNPVSSESAGNSQIISIDDANFWTRAPGQSLTAKATRSGIANGSGGWPARGASHPAIRFCIHGNPSMDESQARLARNLLLLDDLEGASRIAEDEIEKVADQGNGTELWGFRFVRAEVMRLRGKPEQALMYLESRESLNHPDGQDIESQAALYMHRGYHLGLMARYEPAHKLLAEAEVIVRRGGLIELQAEVCLQQAMIFFLQKNYTVSDQIYRDVLSRSNELGGWYFRATSLRGIGKKLMNQRHYEEAMRWLEESLKMFESAGARLSTATVWSELGVCHLGLGDDTGALDLFQRSAQVNQESGAIHNYNYQVALANTGNVYLHRRDYLTALSYYEKALALAHEINDPVSVKKWTYNIRLAYARIRAAIDEQNPRTA